MFANLLRAMNFKLIQTQLQIQREMTKLKECTEARKLGRYIP